MRVHGTAEDAPPSPANSVILRPVPSSLAARLGQQYASDKMLLHFLSSLLKVDPAARCTSAQMLAHPWLDGQKEAHSQTTALMHTPPDGPEREADASLLDARAKLDEGDPDEPVQAASEPQHTTAAPVALAGIN